MPKDVQVLQSNESGQVKQSNASVQGKEYRKLVDFFVLYMQVINHSLEDTKLSKLYHICCNRWSYPFNKHGNVIY
jgi:hypothetical protein